MIRVFAILQIVLLISCRDGQNHVGNSNYFGNVKAFQIQLRDSLGSISFFLPIRYDTNFQWIHFGDCGKPCDLYKYRFQNKLLPVNKEFGSFWKEPEDSVDRFTICHKSYLPIFNSDTSRIFSLFRAIKEQIKSNPINPTVIFDTIQKINDRFFSVIIMEKIDTIQRKKVLAITTVKNNIVRFEYEFVTRKNDSFSKDFIKNSLDLIKSIRVTKGP